MHLKKIRKSVLFYYNFVYLPKHAYLIRVPINLNRKPIKHKV